MRIKRFSSMISLAGKSFLICVIAVLASANLAKAQQPSIQQIAPGVWVAGIPSDEFEYFAAPRTAGHQRQSNWCWAATVQMVLNYRGVPVTQEQVVQRIFNGAVPNVPGQPEQILTALTGWAFTRNGQPVLLSSVPVALNGTKS